MSLNTLRYLYEGHAAMTAESISRDGALKGAGCEGAVGLEYLPPRLPEEGLEEILRQMPL